MRLSSEDALSAQVREQEQVQIVTDSEIHKIDVGVAYLFDKAAGVSGKSYRDTVSADSHVAAPSSLRTLPAGFNMQMWYRRQLTSNSQRATKAKLPAAW